MFASAQFAGEIEKGTIETMLAQPISRLKFFFSKYFAGLIYIVSFTLISVYCVIPLAAIHDVSYSTSNLNKIAALALLFAVAVFSLGMLSSTIFSEKGRANFAVGGLLILMYVANVISAFKDSLKDLKYVSFFHYFDYSGALVRGVLEAKAIWVFLGVAIAATIMAAIWFRQRDIAV